MLRDEFLRQLPLILGYDRRTHASYEVRVRGTMYLGAPRRSPMTKRSISRCCYTSATTSSARLWPSPRNKPQVPPIPADRLIPASASRSLTKTCPAFTPHSRTKQQSIASSKRWHEKGVIRAAVKVDSLKARQWKTSQLCFGAGGILGKVVIQLGASITAPFDFTSFDGGQGGLPLGDPSLLSFNSARILSAPQVIATLLAWLRAEPRKADLDKAVNARQNAYFAKYGNASNIISTINCYYCTSATAPRSRSIQHAKALLRAERSFRIKQHVRKIALQARKDIPKLLVGEKMGKNYPDSR